MYKRQLEGAARGMPAAQRPGVKALTARLRDRQAQGNQRLVETLEHAERTELRERLLALAVAAEERG